MEKVGGAWGEMLVRQRKGTSPFAGLDFHGQP